MSTAPPNRPPDLDAAAASPDGLLFDYFGVAARVI